MIPTRIWILRSTGRYLPGHCCFISFIRWRWLLYGTTSRNWTSVLFNISRRSQRICIRFRENIFRERFLCCWHVCRCMKKAECRSAKWRSAFSLRISVRFSELHFCFWSRCSFPERPAQRFINGWRSVWWSCSLSASIRRSSTFPEDPGAVYQERPFHPDHLPADDQVYCCSSATGWSSV